MMQAYNSQTQSRDTSPKVASESLPTRTDEIVALSCREVAHLLTCKEDSMAKQLRSSSERTYPLKVANTGFLLDRLGEDCHPLQFLRELTQNGIEAILRTPE